MSAGDITAGLVIRPGDRVIVGLVADVDREDVDAVRAALRERLPGVEVIVVSGLTAVAVYREGET